MAKELKDYKEQVYSIMWEHEQARNSDWTLVAHFVHKYRPELVHVTAKSDRNRGGELCVPLNQFKNFPSAETLIRERRVIQNNDGDLLPTDPKVTKARRIKEQNYREAEVREAKQHLVNYPDK